MDVIVIGLGSMGKRRIRLLKKMDRIHQIIGVDGRKDRREEAGKMFGCRTYQDMADALQKHPQADCVFICTSPLSHAALVSQALQQDRHVFTELNLVSDGYQENMALAAQKGKVLFLSSTFYYREEVRFLYQKLKGRKNLNYIYHIGQYLPDWHPWESYQDFFVSDKRTNGCREIMAIELPWLTGLFGKIKNFHVVSDKISGLQIPYQDNYLIQIGHESGNKGILAVDIVSPKAVRNLELYGEGYYYSWDGSPTGLAFFDPADGKMKPVRLYEEINQLEEYRSFVVENAYEKEIQEFLNTVEGTSQPLYGFADDWEILNLIDQIEGASHG